MSVNIKFRNFSPVHETVAIVKQQCHQFYCINQEVFTEKSNYFLPGKITGKLKLKTPYNQSFMRFPKLLDFVDKQVEKMRSFGFVSVY